MVENMEAEQSLLGMAISDYGCAQKLVELPDDTFSFPINATIFKAIRRIVINHKRPDIVTLSAEAPADCPEFMQEVMKCVRTYIGPSLWRQHEQVCLDLRKRRRLRKVCSNVLTAADDNTQDVDELSAALVQAANDNGNKPQSTGITEAVIGFVQELDKVERMNTGLAGLDRLTGGLRNGSLNIIGARPGVGKTALALSITRYVAAKSGPVLFVSLEMSVNEIMARLFSAETRVDMQKIVNNRISPEERVAIFEATEQMRRIPIRFCMATSPLQIRREASAMQREGGLKMIVVDYIQLMRSDEQRKSRYEEVSNISRELKLMAMELNVPIIALTQFNRESENGGTHRKPAMSEARDSGSIEQDANTFMVLWAPDQPKDEEIHDIWLACQQRGSELQFLSVDKNRQGPTGSIPLEFDKQHMRYSTIL